MENFFAFDFILTIDRHGRYVLFFGKRSKIRLAVKNLLGRAKNQAGPFFMAHFRDRLGRFHVDSMGERRIFFAYSGRRVGRRMEAKIKIL